MTEPNLDEGYYDENGQWQWYPYEDEVDEQPATHEEPHFAYDQQQQSSRPLPPIELSGTDKYRRTGCHGLCSARTHLVVVEASDGYTIGA
jgi:hypothetical protein